MGKVYRRITIQDMRIDCVPLNNIKVESTKRSLFIQIHVVSDCILKLRIPLLFAVVSLVPGDM